MRIEKAKALLLTNKYSVSEVGKMVGFSNSKRFIEIFKQVESVTPGKYRHSFFGERLYTYDVPEFLDSEDEIR